MDLLPSVLPSALRTVVLPALLVALAAPALAASAAADLASAPSQLALPRPPEDAPLGNSCTRIGADAGPARAPARTLKSLSTTAQDGSADGSWKLERTFHDDFDWFNLEEERWLPFYDGGYEPEKRKWLGGEWGSAKRTLAGNKEQQIYVDPGFTGTGKVPLGRNPFSTKDGVLQITASSIPDELRASLFDFHIQSGLLTSRSSFLQTYGYFEMRARLPVGKALWPAFWMLQADKAWPPEIDILEADGAIPDEVRQTLHSVGPDGKRVATGCRTPFPTATTGFHNYGLLWSPERVVWYLDRQPIAQARTPDSLNRPMYLLMNLAVGGVMVGAADDQTPLPATMAIDRVSAWKLPGFPVCRTRLAAPEQKVCTPS